eukprot:3130125-Pyramimonas_sp.AAC.2
MSQDARGASAGDPSPPPTGWPVEAALEPPGRRRPANAMLTKAPGRPGRYPELAGSRLRTGPGPHQ